MYEKKNFKKLSLNQYQLSLVSFDLEWTKNFKITGGNKPFCFSYIYFNPVIKVEDIETTLEFSFISCYINSESEIESLVNRANELLDLFLSSNTLIIGHQLSSDIAVILQNSNSNSTSFSTLKKSWHSRKNDNFSMIFDTRYDMNNLLKNKSRRLVDICIECNLGVTQPELKGSMTKMQNEFYICRDVEIYEKLSVLNIRHSLSVALLYLIYKENRIPRKKINVNKILYKNLEQYYSYVRSDGFESLLH